MTKANTVKFGEHIIIDAYGCALEPLSNMELCYDVLDNLAKIADMHKLNAPYVIKAGENETLGGKDPGGFSGFLVIQESHISVHTFAKRGFATIDVYSCKQFKSSEEIVEYVKKVFKATDIDVLKLERGMKYPRENIY